MVVILQQLYQWYRRQVRQFKRDNRGIILIFTALAAIPTTALVYGGIDAARGYSMKAQMMQAVGLGLLSSRYLMVNGSGPGDAQCADIIRRNFNYRGVNNAKIQVNNWISGNQYIVNASFNMPLSSRLSKYLPGQNRGDFKDQKFIIRHASAAQRAYRPIEMALAVDVMDFKDENGQRRNIGEMLIGTPQLYQELRSMQQSGVPLRLAVIPYGSTVNVAGSLDVKFLSRKDNYRYWNGCVMEPGFARADQNHNRFDPYKVYFYDQFSQKGTMEWDKHNCPIAATPLTNDMGVIRMGAGGNYAGPSYSLNPYSHVHGNTEISSAKPLHELGLAWAWRMLGPDWGDEDAWGARSPSQERSTIKMIVLLAGQKPAIERSVREYMDWWGTGNWYEILGIPIFEFLTLTNINHYSAFGYREDMGLNPLGMAAYIAAIGWLTYKDQDIWTFTPGSTQRSLNNFSDYCSRIKANYPKIMIYNYMFASQPQTKLYDVEYQNTLNGCTTDLGLKSVWDGRIPTFGRQGWEIQNDMVGMILYALQQAQKKAAYIKLI